MPIYEYRCSSCGCEKEFLQKISDPAVTQCPECGGNTMVKLISAAGFQLKGSGWYATDFKNGAKSKSDSQEKSEKAAACGGSCACAAAASET